MKNFNPLDLSNKKILITGASSGIGKATAIYLSKLGAQIVATGRNLKRLEMTFEQLVGNHHKIIAFDLCDLNNIGNLFLTAIEDGTKFDGMVHSAGIPFVVPLRGLTPKLMQECFESDFFCFIELVRQFSKTKFSNNSSSIVAISSITAEKPVIGEVGYVTAKSALNASIRSMAIELSKKKIRINGILAGNILSEMSEKAFAEYENRELKDKEVEMSLCGRWGTCDDVAAACAFLISEMSSFTTASLLDVGGGYKIGMYLFKTLTGQELTENDFLQALKQVEACNCKTLFIHSDIMFGGINPEIKRSEYMQILMCLFKDLDIENIIMPTFTYSFNNGRNFDVRESRSLMGTLSEAFRKTDGVYRTLDPMLSFAVKGNLSKEFENFKFSNNSLGENSFYDFLNKQSDVKYLFFGADLADCFTYVHYVEKMIEVPYRFDMNFSGSIIDYSGKSNSTDWGISTQCGGVKLYEKNEHFKESLIREMKLNYISFGEREISCIKQDVAREEIIKKIDLDKFYFLKQPYKDEDLTHIYVMKQDGKLVTHC